MGKDEIPEESIDSVFEGPSFIDDPREEADRDLSYREIPGEGIIDLVDEIQNDTDNLEPVVAEDEPAVIDDEKIYDLTDVFEEFPEDISGDRESGDPIKKMVAEIAEKIAREIVPDIAERVIREEIEKLKSGE